MPKPEFGEFAFKNPDIASRISYRWSLARLVAWTAQRNNNPDMMRRAWQLLMEGDGFGIQGDLNHRPVTYATAPQPLGNGMIVKPAQFISTNQAAQWGLNAIAILALGGEYLTDEIAALKPQIK